MTLLDELKRTELLQGEELDNALIAIRDEYTSEEDRKLMAEYMDSRFDEIRKELDALEEKVDILTAKEQLGELYDILPLSYIAERYFKRSRGWLYQRLNGYSVNGKACGFSEDDKKTFNLALREVGERIGSAQLS